MKATELRINNWFKEDMTEGGYAKITAEQILDLYDDPLDDFYQPIPLTEEWLFKFGFETNYPKVKDKFYSLNRFMINSFNFGNGFRLNTGGAIEYNSIKYVHHLQNLYFALTSLELEIK